MYMCGFRGAAAIRAEGEHEMQDEEDFSDVDF